MKGITVMIFGCHGRIGSVLLKLAPTKFHVIGLAREPDPLIPDCPHEYIQMDVTNRKAAKDIIIHHKPRFIVNSAAIANVDRCEIERELCWRVNVEGIENIIAGAKKVGAKIIHLSTDFIFDGTSKDDYKEDDRPNPINYYGKSKLASENIIKTSGLDSTVVRTASVVQPLSIKGISNFGIRTLDALRAGEVVKVPSNEIRNPAYAANLCRGIWKLIQLDRSGVFHMAGSETTTRYDFSVRLAEKFQLNPELLHQVPNNELSQRAKRPFRSVLSVTKASSELCFEFYNVEQCITALYNDLASGR